MKLTDLRPEFIGAGGEGVYRQTDRLCPRCNGDNAGSCEACHGSGREYEPAPRREGVGVIFDCPCGADGEHHRCYVPFANPLDGGPPNDPKGWNSSGGWQREGDTFDTLTLRPSIRRNPAHGGCGWHGFITKGEVTGQVEP
jgi:hypothetical protein